MTNNILSYNCEACGEEIVLAVEPIDLLELSAEKVQECCQAHACDGASLHLVYVKQLELGPSMVREFDPPRLGEVLGCAPDEPETLFVRIDGFDMPFWLFPEDICEA